MRRSILALLSFITFAAPLSSPLVAQQDPPPGIRLSGAYDARQRPTIAVRPFASSAQVPAALDSLVAIIRRDLEYSNRYNMASSIPESLREGEVDYAQWNSLNVVYLVTGELVATGRGYELALDVHDVVYRRLLHQARYGLPGEESPDFRMAVHAISDEVVQRTLNVPGSAATRIAMSRQNQDANGSYDLLIVDSDGFGLRRIAGFGGQLYSPSWSPDARRVLYAVHRNEGWRLVERDVASGSQREVSPGGEMVLSPAYAPDGRTIALGLWRNSGAEIATYDLAEQCCLRTITSVGRSANMNPSWSPDGRQIAFNSDRLGNPAVYIMAADGSSTPALLSPYSQGSYYTSPSWSPIDTRVAFHGRWNLRMRGSEQIMIADASRPGGQIEQITSRGTNEDPSWAPDGRNLVYTSVGDGPAGLYVIDIETKNRRMLVSGGNMRMADWSPRLLRASDLVVRP